MFWWGVLTGWALTGVTTGLVLLFFAGAKRDPP